MPDGRYEYGVFTFRIDKPLLKLDNGEVLTEIDKSISYNIQQEIVVDDKNQSMCVDLSTPLEISLKPIFAVSKLYSMHPTETYQDIFPPSSNFWFGRMLKGDNQANYVIQRIEEKEQYWLTIVEPGTGKIYESHEIQPYEIQVLKLRSLPEYWYEKLGALVPSNSQDVRERILSIIDDAPLSWNQINDLTEDIAISPIRRGTSARELFNQLLPMDDFKSQTREEVIAFITWVAKKITPDKDIIEFLDELRPLPSFRSLVNTHMGCVFGNLGIPPYLKLAVLATESQPVDTTVSLDVQLEKDPLILLLYKLENYQARWYNMVVEKIESLNKTGEIATVIPSSQTSPKNSQQSQLERLVMSSIGLRLRGYVEPQTLGLSRLMYVGAAHRWPHSHMSYSIRFDSSSSKYMHLHVMIMPPSSVEKVKRVIPSAIEVEWSMQIMNLDHFDKKSSQWTVNVRGLLSSFGKSTSLRTLKKKFGSTKSGKCIRIDKDDAKVLDMISSIYYITDLETERGRLYWGMDGNYLKQILEKLKNLGIVRLYYWFTLGPKLSSILTIAQGAPKQVYSLTNSLLSCCPTSLSLIGKGGTISVTLSRVPHKDIQMLMNLLPQEAKVAGLNVRCMVPFAHRNYTCDLYQRLLRPDGSWDNDVSGLIKQVRSAPKHIKDEVMQEMS